MLKKSLFLFSLVLFFNTLYSVEVFSDNDKLVKKVEYDKKTEQSANKVINVKEQNKQASISKPEKQESIILVILVFIAIVVGVWLIIKALEKLFVWFFTGIYDFLNGTY